VTLREEHILRVYENRALRRIFGAERNEVTGGWRKPHDKVLCDLYNLNDEVKEDEMARTCRFESQKEKTARKTKV
jgi:hypothetical protein